MLNKGDKVVMHTCMAASVPKFNGKVWTCETDEFIAENEKPAVLLEGFQGPFATEYLQKVSIPNVREQVLWFAEQMEAKLQENDHKGGWSNCDFPYLFIECAKKRRNFLTHTRIRPRHSMTSSKKLQTLQTSP